MLVSCRNWWRNHQGFAVDDVWKLDSCHGMSHTGAQGTDHIHHNDWSHLPLLHRVGIWRCSDRLWLKMLKLMKMKTGSPSRVGRFPRNTRESQMRRYIVHSDVVVSLVNWRHCLNFQCVCSEGKSKGTNHFGFASQGTRGKTNEGRGESSGSSMCHGKWHISTLEMEQKRSMENE